MGRLRNSADQLWRKRLSGESGKILLAAAVGMTALILTGLSGGPSGENGAESGFQYVSNHVIPSEKNVEVTWYAERLSDDEWGECYGGDGAEEIKLPLETGTEAVSVLTQQEKQRLQEEAVSAAALCAAYCAEAGIGAPQAAGARLLDLSKKQRTGIVKCLGEQGLVSVSDGVNMENYGKMEEFYEAYTSGGEALATVFEVRREGELCAKTFIYREGSLQSYYVSAGFSEGEGPVIKDAGAKDLEEVRMTEKGYFIYTNAATVMHGNLREYYRVKPLPDRCRELTDRYVCGLSYVNYNMLVTDWDAGNAEDILVPCMFEDIYRICTGEPFRAENGHIPAAVYEKIMTTYFPVSAQQLREHCGYRADTDSYPYEMILGKQFPPFGEVVDYRENGDGTITLYVDGVWIDYGSDKAFRNRIVVKPFEDGTFRYLSNSIEKRELEIPGAGEPDAAEQREKGYDLPIEPGERKEAEEDCRKMMGLIRERYVQADKGGSLNAVLPEEVLSAMQKQLGKTGEPVTITGLYANMENFESAERFLEECAEGRSGSVVIYEIRSDGGIRRQKFLFDGTDLYVLAASAVWNDKNEMRMANVSRARIEEWNFTGKGFFCYRMCVPKPPEVTEIVDGSCMLRVKPITRENRELSEKYVLGLGYQGNNLLCSDWDAAHMENLDYNGLYEYLYAMKYQENYEPESPSDGIPKEEFESLMSEYLPVTEEELQEYAVYDEKDRTYAWEGLPYSNYVRTYFGTSFPEITGRRENGDGTVTFTVDAVCRMFLCDDAVITHELTVRLCGDGSFQYLGNRILGDGAKEIPAYQYRVSGR